MNRCPGALHLGHTVIPWTPHWLPLCLYWLSFPEGYNVRAPLSHILSRKARSFQDPPNNFWFFRKRQLLCSTTRRLSQPGCLPSVTEERINTVICVIGVSPTVGKFLDRMRPFLEVLWGKRQLEIFLSSFLVLNFWMKISLTGMRQNFKVIYFACPWWVGSCLHTFWNSYWPLGFLLLKPASLIDRVLGRLSFASCLDTSLRSEVQQARTVSCSAVLSAGDFLYCTETTSYSSICRS